MLFTRNHPECSLSCIEEDLHGLGFGLVFQVLFETGSDVPEL